MVEWFRGRHSREMMFHFVHVKIQVTLKNPTVDIKEPVRSSGVSSRLRYQFGSPCDIEGKDLKS